MQVDTEDIRELCVQFGKLEDPRSHINRKHLLGDVMVICSTNGFAVGDFFFRVLAITGAVIRV